MNIYGDHYILIVWVPKHPNSSPMRLKQFCIICYLTTTLLFIPKVLTLQIKKKSCLTEHFSKDASTNTIPENALEIPKIQNTDSGLLIFTI